ncbi:neutral zinc metallopeptidase [Nocardia stercoris]|uniref:Peptidase n=1 Tax=Nocardia stercoris TaxID=2483361 RepID=A0A3M2LL58_9NOCA|nr:neutral zinc metallopeptidase [Nocardia stercoris]RMI35558.1 peptidase [Nocardia stercoris]
MHRTCRAAAVVTLVLAAAACSAHIGGPAQRTTPATVHGDPHDPVNVIAAQAIDDLQHYWSEQFPAVYGRPYTPVEGGFYAVDPSTGPLPPCAKSAADIAGNAFYCADSDDVAWDVAGLLPDLRRKFGDFVVPVVLAHEWGHAVQARAHFQGITVTREIQADCFAGAWAAHVAAGDSVFHLQPGDLDNALAGFLSLRDEPGTDRTDPSAHGSGFDRVNSFQTGFDGGPGACKDYRDGSPGVVELPFRSQQDAAEGGNAPYDQVLQLAPADLEDYWHAVYPELTGTPWTPVRQLRGFDAHDAPACGGAPTTGYSLFYCVPDNYIGYDATGAMPEFYTEGGDFAVATLLATQYGLAVNARDGDTSDDRTASLRGDCYAGAWAASVLLENRPRSTLRMSPGDLDKALTALLTFRGNGDTDRQGSGYTRVEAYRAGLTDGADACKGPMPTR